MKRYWKLKALLLLGALALLLFGINETQSDPTLRALKPLSISALEAGERAPIDQYVEIADGYLLPFHMIETTHSRKRGDHTYVYVPVGSQAMQARAHDGQTIKPVLWVRLQQDFRTVEAARAAMQVDAIYTLKRPVRGVVRSLEDSVQEEMQKQSRLQIDGPMALHEGSSPLSLGAGVGFAFAGGLLILVLLIWTGADLLAQRWREALAPAGTALFAGDSAQILFAVVGVPLFVGLGGMAVAERMESGALSPVLLGLAALGLALAAWGFWRNRAAALLSDDTLVIVRGSQRQTLALADVQSLVLDERKVRGVSVAKYTLHGSGKPVQVGSGLFKGGIDRAEAFGLALRERLMPRLAPRLMAQMARGEWVSFGLLSVGQQGLTKGKPNAAGDVLTWADIKAVKLVNGQLKITQNGKLFAWGNFAVKKLHNVDVLLIALREHGVSV